MVLFLYILTPIARLDQVRQNLETVAAQSGAQVQRLLQICDENAQLQMEFRKHLQADVLQNIMTMLLSVDMDRNFELSPLEVDRLVQRLRLLPDTVQFHEANFRAVLAQDQGNLTITDVCNIVRAFNTDLVDQEHAVFSFQKIRGGQV